MNNINKNEKFEEIYISHYSRMKRFAQEYVIREEDAENIVQDVFLDVWEKKLFLISHTNMFSFLFTSVKNRCLDFLRHKTVIQKTANIIQEEHSLVLEMKLNSLEEFDEIFFSEPDIETIVLKAIENLPEKCRQIFLMNKIEGKKQKVIAEELNISINTVESQMGIAYKKLKELLKDYVSLLIFFIV
ncbi:MAG: RNA polymerase sigma-70 factor [Dysgonamonadaceae bacterium]